MLFELAQ